MGLRRRKWQPLTDIPEQIVEAYRGQQIYEVENSLITDDGKCIGLWFVGRTSHLWFKRKRLFNPWTRVRFPNV